MVDASESVKIASKELKANMTKAERVLWSKLRDRRFLNLKFRRQVPFKRFILDFFCPSAKLVIEIDGDYHKAQPQKDAERDATLNGYGLRVLRISNDIVLNDIDKALELIHDEL